ncbi:MAG TPA: substrate-binding domain-containing protein [Acidobacteriota bacterium]|nr:substrate-binding domain-containing protein [Acidobacteriota bacterium]
MNRRPFLSLLLFFPILSWWITAPKPQELQIAASGNIRDIMTEVARFAEARNPMTKIKLFFGTAEEVARQIDSHASFDVYIGDQDDMDYLNDEGRLVEHPPIQLFMDQAVAVAPGDTDWDITDAKQLTPDNVKKIALMHEDTRWGAIGRDYLEKYGVLDAVKDKITDVKTLHGAIEAIKRGDAKWTIVTSSEAARRKNLKLLWKVPVTDIPGQTFSAARLTCSRNQELGARILAGLQSSIVRRMFENAGFQLLTPPPDNRDPKK